MTRTYVDSLVVSCRARCRRQQPLCRAASAGPADLIQAVVEATRAGTSTMS